MRENNFPQTSVPSVRSGPLPLVPNSMRNRALGPELCLQSELASVSFRFHLLLNSGNPKNVPGPIRRASASPGRYAATGKMSLTYLRVGLAVGTSSAEGCSWTIQRTRCDGRPDTVRKMFIRTGPVRLKPARRCQSQKLPTITNTAILKADCLCVFSGRAREALRILHQWQPDFSGAFRVLTLGFEGGRIPAAHQRDSSSAAVLPRSGRFGHKSHSREIAPPERDARHDGDRDPSGAHT